MNPRTPTQSELEDIFRNDGKKLNVKVHVGKHDYSINLLRTEYENLEDRLGDLDYHVEVYDEPETEKLRMSIYKKMNDIHRSIERLKELNGENE